MENSSWPVARTKLAWFEVTARTNAKDKTHKDRSLLATSAEEVMMNGYFFTVSSSFSLRE